MSGIVAKLIEMFAKNMAIMACGAASTWGGYQAKEPKNIFEKYDQVILRNWEVKFMKLGKRFAAMGAAMVMAAAMAVNSSAVTPSVWQDFGLHYTSTAPTSANVTTQSLGGYADVYSVHTNGKLTVRTILNTFTGTQLVSKGYVWDSSLGTGGAWACVTTITQTSTGTKSATGSYPNATAGKAAKVDVTLNYGSATTAKAYGETVAS